MTNQNGQCVICKTGVRRVRLFPGNRSAKSLPPHIRKKRINQFYVIRFYQGEDIFSHWSIANKTSPFMGPPTFHPALKRLQDLMDLMKGWRPRRTGDYCFADSMTKKKDRVQCACCNAWSALMICSFSVSSNLTPILNALILQSQICGFIPHIHHSFWGW